jgi:hypothetical protein
MAAQLLALAFALVSVVCLVLVLRHAFSRSLGTGVMVLLVPFYVLVYAFTQFEHPRKNVLVSALFASGVLSAVFYALGALALMRPPVAPPPF